MQLTCKVNQKEAIRRGIDSNSTVKLEVDPANLTEEQREALASRFKNGELHVDSDIHYLPEPTFQGLIHVLDIIASDRAKIKKQEELFRAKQEALKTQKLAEFDADPRSFIVFSHWTTPPHWSLKELQMQDLDEKRMKVFNSIVEELEPQRLKATAEEQEKRNRLAAEKKAAEEADKAARLARTEALKLWSLEFGSEKLRLLIQEGFQWTPQAKEEWRDFMIRKAGIEDEFLNDPEGYEPDWEKSENPSETQLKSLVRIRQALAKVPEMEATASLLDIVYKEETECEEPDVIRRTEIRISVCGLAEGASSRFILAE